MKVNYYELVNFYTVIYNTIFNEIDLLYPNKYEGLIVKYSDEYLKAYGYLQRAGWRLEEVRDMEKYYSEDDFKYFGLENLYDVRNRIEHYLKDTETEFSDLVYQYGKFDEIFSEYKNERLTNEASEKFTYYEIKLVQQKDYDFILNTLTMLSDDVKKLKNEIKESKYVKNIHNKKLNKIKKMIEEVTGDIKDDM